MADPVVCVEDCLLKFKAATRTPEDLERPAVFLASDASDFVIMKT